MSSIQRRLIDRLGWGAAVFLTVGGVAVFTLTRAALQREFDAALRAKAMAITAATEQDEDEISIDLNGGSLRGVGEWLRSDLVQMWRRDTGAVVERSPSLQTQDLPEHVGTLERPELWNLTLPSGDAGRAVGLVFRPRPSEERDGGTRAPTAELALVVASSRQDLDRTLRTLVLVIAGTGALLLAAAIVFVPRLLRRELMPLARVADQAAHIGAASLSTRFPTAGLPDELMPVAVRLNDLLTRLEQAFNRERQFSGDLAHELRTPIAELRTLAELSMKWPDARGADVDRDSLTIAAQMEGIVTRLLAMLRSEQGQLPVAQERVLLGPLLGSVWTPLTERAAAKQLAVTWSVREGAEVRSDPVLLRSIVANLMENAVEYTPSSGTVRIESEVDGGRFAVRVINSAGELAPRDVPHLFERFWRRDEARTAAQHSGLGLSLAKAFAQAIDCDLTATLDERHQLTLTLSGRAS